MTPMSWFDCAHHDILNNPASCLATEYGVVVEVVSLSRTCSEADGPTGFDVRLLEQTVLDAGLHEVPAGGGQMDTHAFRPAVAAELPAAFLVGFLGDEDAVLDAEFRKFCGEAGQGFCEGRENRGDVAAPLAERHEVPQHLLIDVALPLEGRIHFVLLGMEPPDALAH